MIIICENMSSVKKIYLLDYGQLAGEIGWYLPKAECYVDKDKPKTRQWFYLPVSGALVEHDDGYLLFDTGLNMDSRKLVSKDILDVFPILKLDGNNSIENQLKLLNLKPEDISAVVLSHLHWDHSGQACIFKEMKTPIIVHKKELNYALYSMWIGKSGAYIFENLEPLRGANWVPIEDSVYELYPGIEVILMGGHTPGSLMLKIVTKQGNTYLFTSDFIQVPIELEVENMGWLMGDAEEWYTSIRKLKFLLKNKKTFPIIGHDPDLWNKYPKIPKGIE
jgi:glyoxylase-like metal-dependent hydrolase (beta-lactamase superfamily II)